MVKDKVIVKVKDMLKVENIVSDMDRENIKVKDKDMVKDKDIV